MVSTDPISDMLTRIRNAINVHKREVVLPHSKTKAAIAELLVSNRFLDAVNVVDKAPQKEIVITINGEDSNARITSIDRLSTPGRRLYVGADEIPSVKRGRGLVIVSTSRGLMTGDEAKAARLGGELICKVY